MAEIASTLDTDIPKQRTESAPQPGVDRAQKHWFGRGEPPMRDEPKTFSSPKFRRNFFATTDMHAEGTSDPHRKEKTNKGIKESREATPEKWVQFSDESRHDMADFLENHVLNLQEMLRDNPSIVPEEDKALLKLITNGDIGMTNVDKIEAAIKSKLDDPAMWEIAMARFQDVQMYKRIALAQRTVTLLDNEEAAQGGQRSQSDKMKDSGKSDNLREQQEDVPMTDEQTSREGFVHKGVSHVRENWEEIWNKGLKQTLGTATTVGLGTGLGSIPFVGPVLGPLAAGGFVAWAAYRSGEKSGVEIRDALRSEAEAFKVIQAKPELAEYIKGITKIDPNDFTIDGDGNIKTEPGVMRSRDKDELTKEVIKGQKTINRLQKELGYKKFDASPEEFIFNLAEKTKNDPEASVSMDAAPSRYNERVKHFLEQNPITDPTDVAGNMKKFIEARQKAMMERVEDALESSQANAEPKRKTVQEKLDARKDGGRVKAARTKELQTTKDTLTGDQENLEKTEGQIKAFEDQLPKLKEAQAKRASLTHPDERTKSQDKIDYITTKRAQLERELADILREKNKEWQTQTAALSFDKKVQDKQVQDAYDRVSRQLDIKYGSQEQDYTAKIEKLDKELKPYEETLEKIDEVEKQKVALEPTDAETAVLETYDTLKNDHHEIVEIGFSNDELASMTMEQLLEEINKKNEADKTKGWSKSSNNNKDHRAQLMNAMIEARAKKKELDGRNTDPVLQTQAEYFTTLMRYGIRETQLFMLTPQQIDEMVTEKRGLYPHTMGRLEEINVEHIMEAQQEAERRLKNRTEEVRGQLKNIKRAKEVNDQEIKDIDKSLKTETDELRTVATLMSRRREHISDKAFTLTVEMDKYTDATAITDDGEFTKAEQEAGLTPGALKLYDFLFDYKNGFKESENGPVTETREAYFKRIMETLPPDKLAELLDKSLFPTSQLSAHDLPNILNDIQEGIKDKQFTYRDIRRAFRDVIDSVYTKTGRLD